MSRLSASITQSRYFHMSRAVVLLVAVGVGVAREVEPRPRPALAVVRRGEQPIDDALVGVGRACRRGTRRPPPASAAGPIRSSETRRSSVAFGASGDGVSCSRSSRASTNAIDRIARPVRPARPPAAPDAPASRRPSAHRSCRQRGRVAGRHLRALVDPGPQLRNDLGAGSGSASSGIRSSSFGSSTRRIISLRWLSPATTTGPDCPPLRIHSGLCSRSWARAFDRPWHSEQYLSKIGWMSWAKSTAGCPAARGDAAAPVPGPGSRRRAPQRPSRWRGAETERSLSGPGNAGAGGLSFALDR